MSADLIGNVAALAGLLAYQEGAVVSRTLIDRETGTVTLFAFDEGEGLSEHTAPYDALVYLIEGALTITILGEPHELKAGDMLIMPEDDPHALRASERAKMLLVMIRS
jgi:quercetin dioxygenase-like cupin family protein